MKNKIKAVLILIVGVLLILPLIGVNAIGTLTDGILAWVIAIAVLLIGIVRISESFAK